MSVSDIKRLKELDEENRRLKQMFALLSLDYQVLKDIAEKSCRVLPVARVARASHGRTWSERTQILSDLGS